MTKIIKYQYLSMLKDEIESFIKFKRSCNYIYNNEAKFLKAFDNFIIKNGYDYGKLDKKLVDAWTAIKDTECINSRNSRVDPVRSLAEYINTHGGEAYVCQKFKKQPRPVLYIPSEEEIAAFLHFVDLNAMKYINMAHAFMYSVLYRLYYTTGLREIEGASLKWDDVNWDIGKIYVENGKGGKPRYVYVSDDFLILLERYRKKMYKIGLMTPFIFPNRTLDNYISDILVRIHFSTLRKKFYNDKTHHKDINIHRFRHCYVVHKLKEFIENGEDIDNIIMYLCRQLGHTSVNETYKYIHSVEHMLPSTRKFITHLSGELYNHDIREF